MAAVALVDGRPAIPTETGQRGTCIGPQCRAVMVAKVGNVVRPHWAHTANSTCDLDDPTGETGWHLTWRTLFTLRGAATEVPIGNHRADIQLADGRIIEFQTTFLTPPAIKSREHTYQHMAWLYRMTQEPHTEITSTLTSITVAWTNPRPAILSHHQPVYMQWHDTVWHLHAITEGPTPHTWHLHLDQPHNWVEFSEHTSDGHPFGAPIDATALIDAITKRTREHARHAYTNTATLQTLIEQSDCTRGGGRPSDPHTLASTTITAQAPRCDICHKPMVVGQTRRHYTCAVPT